MRDWWKRDGLRRGLLIGGFAYALFFLQGIPFWDDDFTSWYWKIKDTSVWTLLLQWLSPISTQPQYWGFNERPLQAILYKLSYFVAGYESWPYLLVKSAAFAGLGVMIYEWGRLIAGRTDNGRRAAFAAAGFFLLTPNPMAAMILLQDAAPFAELIFLVLTWVIFTEIEKTPATWKTPRWSNREHRRWLKRWSAIAFATYLGYKSKADLKLIPAILGGYVLFARPRQWRFFAVPLGLMALLAIPWGPGIFTKLPPFVPGSKGSEIGWMWQPASLERLRDFLYAGDIWDSIRDPRRIPSVLLSQTLSLAGLLGPFLLVPAAGFLLWRTEKSGGLVAVAKALRPRRLLESLAPKARMPERARAFALLWGLAILAATSALPAINFIFRVRYGILTLVPASLLLAWVFAVFADELRRLPRWVPYVAAACFALQLGVNLNRAVHYRREMGQVIVAVDQVYERVQEKFAGARLVLLPDFRPYDYRPDASATFTAKSWLQGEDELSKEKPLETYVISWRPSLSDKLEMVERFPGCRETSVFDAIFHCPAGSGAFLMRYIGQDRLFSDGQLLHAKGDAAGAFKLHGEYLEKFPLSLAGNFSLGLEAFQLKDWDRADRAYSTLERFMPDHLAILYNHALVLSELAQYEPAIERLRYVLAKDPTNYAAMINLYWSYRKAGRLAEMKSLIIELKARFPQDSEVARLSAEGK
jgi:tetratricopeptide (TPR) repeat protein